MRRVVRGVAVGLLALVMTGACASSPAAASPVATSAVDLPPSYRFDPAAIVVAPGTRVSWMNHDNFSHSVQFLDGGLPGDARLMEPGGTTSFTFDRAGLYHYHCSLHPQNMTGTVQVNG